MARWDDIMARIDSGMSDREIAEEYQSDEKTIHVYRMVADGTISPGNAYGYGQLTELGRAKEMYKRHQTRQMKKDRKRQEAKKRAKHGKGDAADERQPGCGRAASGG